MQYLSYWLPPFLPNASQLSLAFPCSPLIQGNRSSLVSGLRPHTAAWLTCKPQLGGGRARTEVQSPVLSSMLILQAPQLLFIGILTNIFIHYWLLLS